MKRSIFLLFCLIWSTLTMAREFDFAELLKAFAKVDEHHARFVETRYLAILNKPIQAHGEVHYRAPDFFEKHTRAPQEEILQLKGERLKIEQNGQQWTTTLSQNPRVAAYVDALPALLQGNLAALSKSYKPTFTARSKNNWTLTLIPHDDSIQAPIQRIEMQGREAMIERIKYVAGDGDLIVMQLEPINDKH